MLGITDKPFVIKQGSVTKGVSFSTTIRLINSTSALIRIEGFMSTCECTMVEGLPIEIPPGEGREVAIFTELAKDPNFVGSLAIKVNLLANTTVVGVVEVDCDVKQDFVTSPADNGPFLGAVWPMWSVNPSQPSAGRHKSQSVVAVLVSRRTTPVRRW